MRNTPRWFKVLTVLAGSSLLFSSGCGGWPMGVNWFFAITTTVLVGGAAAILLAGSTKA